MASSYIQDKDDEEMLDRAEGTKIEWKEGANLCFKSHPPSHTPATHVVFCILYCTCAFDEVLVSSANETIVAAELEGAACLGTCPVQPN